jgi:putative nucleotidyltransferase with HDIG domain
MEYLPIRVSTLRGDQPIDFDAYIKINDKHILYLRKGDSFEGERLKRLKSKNLKKMFIVPENEPDYRTYLTRNIDMAYDKGAGKSYEVRGEIIQGRQQSLGEAVMENPGDEVAYTEAKDSANRFIEFLTGEDPHSVNSILNIENVDQNVAHHGVTVSTLSVALAKHLGITDAKKLQLLSLGAMLHDIEHFYSGIFVARPLKDFTEDELRLYKTHPSTGASIAQGKKHFDSTVINIIAQHEEYIDGKGFPQGLTEAKMDPLAVIVSSANAYDRLMTFEKVPKKDVAKSLLVSSVGKYPLNQIQALGSIINSSLDKK